jgi:hypothetical protein
METMPARQSCSADARARGSRSATQVQQRVDLLTNAELRTARHYERRHATRKSVLPAIDRALVCGQR